MLNIFDIGKSSITLRFVYNEFEDFYDPTQADSYRKVFNINNDKLGEPEKFVEIDILDTAGQEEYAAVNQDSLCYASIIIDKR